MVMKERMFNFEYKYIFLVSDIVFDIEKLKIIYLLKLLML